MQLEQNRPLAAKPSSRNPFSWQLHAHHLTLLGEDTIVFGVKVLSCTWKLLEKYHIVQFLRQWGLSKPQDSYRCGLCTHCCAEIHDRLLFFPPSQGDHQSSARIKTIVTLLQLLLHISIVRWNSTIVLWSLSPLSRIKSAVPRICSSCLSTELLAACTLHMTSQKTTAFTGWVSICRIGCIQFKTNCQPHPALLVFSTRLQLWWTYIFFDIHKKVSCKLPHSLKFKWLKDSKTWQA